MTNDHRIAAELRELFGVEAGARLSAAAVAQHLQRRTVTANRVTAREAAFNLMWDYEAVGLVDDSPGPRRGAGWSLSTKGAALIARSRSPGAPDSAQ